MIIFNPFILFHIPIINADFKIGGRIDITSLFHLVSGFLFTFIDYKFSLGLVLGHEVADGTASDQ